MTEPQHVEVPTAMDLVESIRDMREVSVAMTQLAEAMIQEGKRQNRTTRIFIGAVGVLVLIGLFMTAVVFYNSVNNRPIVRNTESTSAVLADCLTPGGICYERSAQQQRDAIQAIVDEVHDVNAKQTEEILGRIDCLLDGGSRQACGFTPSTTTTTSNP